MRLPVERGPLAQARIAVGKTQKEVSEESGVSRTHLQQLESGLKNLSRLSLERSALLCKSLRISLDRLLAIAIQQEQMSKDKE